MNTKVIKYIAITLIISSVLIFSINAISKKNKINFSGMRNIFIGDSHAIGLGSKINGAEVDTSITKVGWSSYNVINALKNYPVSNDVGRVFLSVGTNGGFSLSDDTDTLVGLLKDKFPNAKLYVIKGSYGWGSNTSISKSKYDSYYNRFAKDGVNVLQNELGYFATSSDAHSTKSNQAISIINEIKSLING